MKRSARVFFGVVGGCFVSTIAVGLGVTWAQNDRALRLADVEASEKFPGGKATTRRSRKHRDAFSRPSSNMGFEGEGNFRIGNAIFRKVWVSSPASTKSSDGLGPLYNARSCQRCHLKDGRGHPPEANWPDDNAVSLLLRLSVPENGKTNADVQAGRAKTVAEPNYGGQLQDHAVQGHDGEGRPHFAYKETSVTLGDGKVVTLRKPTTTVVNGAYGPLHPETMISVRVAPQMIGLGLLEAIPSKNILANVDPEDKNSDGISGRANMVWSVEHEKKMLGRFGWKAGQPTLRQQSADAFKGDMGLSTTLFPLASGDCTKTQTKCLNAPNGNTPEQDNVEVGDQLLDFVVTYAANLAVPGRDDSDVAEVRAGKSVFQNIGCASCHTPSWTTGKHPTQPHLSNQRIWPYTDMLLHDMGDGLADNRPEHDANGHEWRTPPLWGIGLTKTVSGHTYFLHDGRARNLTEAILWHGGEAKAARDGFVALSTAERQALLRFLNSL